MDGRGVVVGCRKTLRCSKFSNSAASWRWWPLERRGKCAEFRASELEISKLCESLELREQ